MTLVNIAEYTPSIVNVGVEINNTLIEFFLILAAGEIISLTLMEEPTTLKGIASAMPFTSFTYN